jgi:hypothetical protein
MKAVNVLKKLVGVGYHCLEVIKKASSISWGGLLISLLA